MDDGTMILKDVELEFTQASHLAGENYREIVEIAATAPDETRRFVGGLHGSLKTGTTHNETTAWTPTSLPSLLDHERPGMSANHFPGAPEHGVLKGRAQRSARTKEACWSRRHL